MERLDQPKRTMLMTPPFSSLVIGNRIHYGCFDELERLLEENEEFRNIIAEGIQAGKVCGFPEKLWVEINDLVYDEGSYTNFETTFLNGANIGDCVKHSIALSFCFPYANYCYQRLPLLKGTRNSTHGDHYFIEYMGNYYDTTLMIVINANFASRLGYNPKKTNCNNIMFYNAMKEQATDPEKKAERKKKRQ